MSNPAQGAFPVRLPLPGGVAVAGHGRHAIWAACIHLLQHMHKQALCARERFGLAPLSAGAFQTPKLHSIFFFWFSAIFLANSLLYSGLLSTERKGHPFAANWKQGLTAMPALTHLAEKGLWKAQPNSHAGHDVHGNFM